MEIVFGDVTLGVKDDDREYIFSYQTAGLESYRKDGKEWLYRAPKPSFWRATTCNDRGNGFSARSSIWLGADMFIFLDDVKIEIDGKNFALDDVKAPKNTLLLSSSYRSASTVSVSFIYNTATTSEAKVVVKYTVLHGRMRVDFEYIGTKGLPELPVCGLRFIMPSLASSYDYTGLSGETYPDRMNGARKGTFHVDGLPVTPYVVPQECGMHMANSYLRINMDNRQIIIKKANDDFNFSLLPYTAEELENAWHQEELADARRTVLLIAAAVRGIGGINSWGAEPEEKYHLPSDRNYKFCIYIE